ncbi:hypothetical protein ABIE67_008943 [Streptomyces sp. V4I8]|uniref:hypothetical protein n=1 Tax=Streptomyces sp. V4I8 TaxID=3156469 RepID=UPI0035132F50
MGRADLDLLGSGRTVPYLAVRSTDTGVQRRILESCTGSAAVERAAARPWQRQLLPLTDASPVLPVDDSLAGWACRTQSLRVEESEAGGMTAWLPLMDGAERLGVLAVHSPTLTPVSLRRGHPGDRRGRTGPGDPTATDPLHPGRPARPPPGRRDEAAVRVVAADTLTAGLADGPRRRGEPRPSTGRCGFAGGATSPTLTTGKPLRLPAGARRRRSLSPRTRGLP